MDKGTIAYYCRGSIPLWELPSAYTIFYFLPLEYHTSPSPRHRGKSRIKPEPMRTPILGWRVHFLTCCHFNQLCVIFCQLYFILPVICHFASYMSFCQLYVILLVICHFYQLYVIFTSYMSFFASYMSFLSVICHFASYMSFLPVICHFYKLYVILQIICHFY